MCACISLSPGVRYNPGSLIVMSPLSLDPAGAMATMMPFSILTSLFFRMIDLGCHGDDIDVFQEDRLSHSGLAEQDRDGYLKLDAKYLSHGSAFQEFRSSPIWNLPKTN